jgi:dipeptidyl aminopeptidase/acylaminoacyl peptidase
MLKSCSLSRCRSQRTHRSSLLKSSWRTRRAPLSSARSRTRARSQAIPDWEKNRDTALAARSPVKWADKLNKTTPILVLHGTADWRAKPKTNAINMAAALYDVKHPFRMILFEGGQHGISEHREEVDRVTREWLDRYVRDRKPWPSLEPHGE